MIYIKKSVSTLGGKATRHPERMAGERMAGKKRVDKKCFMEQYYRQRKFHGY